MENCRCDHIIRSSYITVGFFISVFVFMIFLGFSANALVETPLEFSPFWIGCIVFGISTIILCVWMITAQSEN